MATILRRSMSAAPGVTIRLVSRPRDSEFVVHKRVYQQEVKALRTQWRAELLQKKQQEDDAKRGNVVLQVIDIVPLLRRTCGTVPEAFSEAISIYLANNELCSESGPGSTVSTGVQRS